MSLLKITGLKKKFHKTVFSELSLELQQGELLSILGPSGCGKSTLLKILAGLDEDFEGKLQLPDSTQRSMVFQEPRLLPWKTVLENVLLPFEILKSQSIDDAVEAKAMDWIKTVGLEKDIHLFPYQLSGGMKMRCALARSLITDPKVLFLDEPFAALDEGNRYRLQEILRSIVENRKLSVIFVTHSSMEALFLSDRILQLQADGKITQEKKIHFSEKRDSALRWSEIFRENLAGLAGSMQSQI